MLAWGLAVKIRPTRDDLFCVDKKGNSRNRLCWVIDFSEFPVSVLIFLIRKSDTRPTLFTDAAIVTFPPATTRACVKMGLLVHSIWMWYDIVQLYSYTGSNALLLVLDDLRTSIKPDGIVIVKHQPNERRSVLPQV
jgi:hypothetical protein